MRAFIVLHKNNFLVVHFSTIKLNGESTFFFIFSIKGKNVAIEVFQLLYIINNF